VRIGLNLLHAMPEVGGAWNYIVRLVTALGERDRENSYVAFVTDKSIGMVPRQPNFKTVHVGINPISRPQRVLYENTLLQRDARKQRLDLMHWFANAIAVTNSVPGVVTVHDLQVFENPHAFARIQRIYLQAMFPHTVRRAALLLPVSKTTAHALCNILKARLERMQVIPAIVNASFQPVSSDRVIELRRKYDLPEQFWLYVAHFYPHKNHLRLLQAYYDLTSNGFSPWPLVLRGDDHGAGEKVKSLVTQLGLENNVHFLPHLNEEELPVLYSAATAMVFPSLYEGGGIPVLEAMACGCPVIASDIASVREFGGEAIVQFNPLDLSTIRSTMIAFQQDTEKRLRVRQLGMEQARNHRPDWVIPNLISAYQRAVLR
jgi:glycosyltransferase involved in cell wall biosynthesis